MAYFVCFFIQDRTIAGYRGTCLAFAVPLAKYVMIRVLPFVSFRSLDSHMGTVKSKTFLCVPAYTYAFTWGNLINDCD